VTWLRWVATVITVSSLAGACVAGFGDWGDQQLAGKAAACFIFAALGALGTWALIEVFADLQAGRHNG